MLHAECGQGELLLALAADGTGAYGVTTDVEAAADALGGTLDMQAADPVDHLRVAAPESVDGLFTSLLTAPGTATDLVALLTAVVRSPGATGAGGAIETAGPDELRAGGPGGPLHPGAIRAAL